MVVAAHLSIQIPSLTPYLSSSSIIDTDRLVAGVDIFFVISGFIMMVTTAGKDMTPAEFFCLRIVRVVGPDSLRSRRVVMLPNHREAAALSTARVGEKFRLGRQARAATTQKPRWQRYLTRVSPSFQTEEP